MRYQTSITIEKPVKEVWKFFINPDNLPKWLSGFKKMEPMSGKPGTLGARSKQFYVYGGIKLELVEEITELAENEKFSSKLSHKDFDTSLSINFIDQGDSTKLDVNMEVIIKNPLYEMFGQMLNSQIKNRTEKDLAKLKELVEKS